MKKVIWPILIIAALFVPSCSTSEPKKEKELSLEGASSDNLQTHMLKAEKNLRYLIYGIVNFDSVKIEKTCRNLVVISQYIAADPTYNYKKKVDEWREMSQMQANYAEDLRQYFLDENFMKVDETFANLVTLCTDCHLVFWDKKVKPSARKKEAR